MEGLQKSYSIIDKCSLIKDILNDRCDIPADAYEDICEALDCIAGNKIGAGVGLMGCKAAIVDDEITVKDIELFVESLHRSRVSLIVTPRAAKEFDDALKERVKKDYPLAEPLTPPHRFVEECPEPIEKNYYKDKRGHGRPYKFHR